MLRFVSGFVLALAFALAPAALAQEGPRNVHVKTPKLIDGVRLDTSPSFTIYNTQGYGLLTAYIHVVDANNTVTSVTMSCVGSEPIGAQGAPAKTYTLQTCYVGASGACSSYNSSWVAGASSGQPLATSGNKYWPWRVDIEGIGDIACTFVGAGTVEAADLIHVEGALSVKG